MSRRHPTLSVPQLKAQLRGSSEYDQWSSEVFERYRQVCRNCGEVLRPEAHHIIRFDTLFQEVLDANQASIRRGEFDLVFHAALDYAPLWDADNGIILCGYGPGRPLSCHQRADVGTLSQAELRRLADDPRWPRRRSGGKELGVDEGWDDHVLEAIELLRRPIFDGLLERWIEVERLADGDDHLWAEIYAEARRLGSAATTVARVAERHALERASRKEVMEARALGSGQPG